MVRMVRDANGEKSENGIKNMKIMKMRKNVHGVVMKADWRGTRESGEVGEECDCSESDEGGEEIECDEGCNVI